MKVDAVGYNYRHEEEFFMDQPKGTGCYLLLIIKATPHNPWLTPLHVICLHIFRHITQILLALRQQGCVKFRQSDEKSDFASDAQSLCGIA